MDGNKSLEEINREIKIEKIGDEKISEFKEFQNSSLDTHRKKEARNSESRKESKALEGFGGRRDAYAEMAARKELKNLYSSPIVTTTKTDLLKKHQEECCFTKSTQTNLWIRNVKKKCSRSTLRSSWSRASRASLTQKGKILRFFR